MLVDQAGQMKVKPPDRCTDALAVRKLDRCEPGLSARWASQQDHVRCRLWTPPCLRAVDVVKGALVKRSGAERGVGHLLNVSQKLFVKMPDFSWQIIRWQRRSLQYFTDFSGNGEFPFSCPDASCHVQSERRINEPVGAQLPEKVLPGAVPVDGWVQDHTSRCGANSGAVTIVAMESANSLENQVRWRNVGDEQVGVNIHRLFEHLGANQNRAGRRAAPLVPPKKFHPAGFIPVAVNCREAAVKAPELNLCVRTGTLQSLKRALGQRNRIADHNDTRAVCGRIDHLENPSV